MSRRAIRWLIMLAFAVSALVSYALASDDYPVRQSDSQKQQMERWKILQHTQTKRTSPQNPQTGTATGLPANQNQQRH
jgi:hypothetical protein